ncbi:hypothetical protein CTAYLR_004691 [Chrysophaeum taylorii]|uniref:FAD dependent oxidoreductase domain-containing protein n=1 Tax=Chrysophaeum taylorii TaxID=2483200 RepID=A0AAD7U9Q9_9STRA|nr:hypothetical protein CTAYLR_004691 [Chrysophaeum taylorii]
MIAEATTTKVVIVGGGLQGCASAYFLRDCPGVEVTIVERTAIGAAASGKGGGFLAKNWGSGPTKALHEQSFELHSELANRLGVESYRRISTLEVTSELGLREWPPKPVATKPIKRSALHPKWLDASDTKSRLMDHDTAQVMPLELCEKLFAASGASLVASAARGLRVEDGRCVGVRTDDGLVPADQVVVAMGAWSVLLEDWLPGAAVPMEGVYSTSVVYDAVDDVRDEPFALFCAEDSNACHLECYPRPDGSIYLCGIGGSQHVYGPRLREGGDLQDASKMKANPGRVEAAHASFSKMAPAFADKTPRITQACMRPCAPDALPLLGKFDPALGLPDNLILATGHNCWGILWAPITGKLVADLILGNTPSVDLAPFSPGRFISRPPRRGRAMVNQPVGEQW